MAAAARSRRSSLQSGRSGRFSAASGTRPKMLSSGETATSNQWTTALQSGRKDLLQTSLWGQLTSETSRVLPDLLLSLNQQQSSTASRTRTRARSVSRSTRNASTLRPTFHQWPLLASNQNGTSHGQPSRLRNTSSAAGQDPSRQPRF